MLLQELKKKELIHPPKDLINATQFLCLMGSQSYGVSSGDSDWDVYGFCIPSKSVVFPHLHGEIPGFGRQTERFNQWQEQHIIDPDSQREYDISVYNIVRYFQLCMEGNPNMVDSLFVPHRCVLHATSVGQMVRENRRIFLHKGYFPKFKGYSYSQMSKIESKNPTGKRIDLIKKYGYDTKFAYHVVRLLDEIEQILLEWDIDLERNREQLKAIRRGEWTLEYLKQYFNDKERYLEELYLKSDLTYSPREDEIKQLLLNCLEHHYGSLKDAIVIPGQMQSLMDDMQTVIDKYSGLTSM